MTPNATEIAQTARRARSRVEQALAEVRSIAPSATSTTDALERAQSLLAKVIADAERLADTLRDLT